MAALLTDAIKPNLLQTLEGGPAFVHCGPFANIAHGNNSVLADRIALATNEIVCTEAGFGADMGAEKFFDIKCRASGLRPDAAVVVATIRALKMHGGVGQDRGRQAARSGAARRERRRRDRGQREPREADRERPALQRAGRRGDQLRSRPTRPRRSRRCRPCALAAGARAAVVANHWAKGGEGATDLATAVWAAAEEGAPDFKLLYPDDASLTSKIEAIATQVYGADGVDLSPAAAKQLAQYEALGLREPADLHGQEPVLAQPRRLAQGPPDGLPPADPRGPAVSAGAGFVTPLAGEMRTMPGLPSTPGGENIDLDPEGEIVGLF